MTFEPGGDPHIPNQIGTSSQRRSSGRDRPPPGSPQAFTRALVRVAVVSSLFLGAAIVGVYVLELVDPDTGMWLVLAAMVPGMVMMTATVLYHQRQRARLAQSPQGSVAMAGRPAAPGGPAHTAGYSTPQTGAHQDDQFSFQVDQSFSITGRGTVVTGRVSAGQIAVGAAVAVTRYGSPVARTIVTGIELSRRTVEVARAGEEPGLLLDGVDRSVVHAGDVIVPDVIPGAEIYS